jgi:hypothetical protein
LGLSNAAFVQHPKLWEDFNYDRKPIRRAI